MQPAFHWTFEAFLMLAVALTVVVGAVVALVVLIKHKVSEASSGAVDGPPVDLSHALASAATAAETAIKRVDPSFTARRLEAHIRTLFQTLSERSVEESRLWLSDGLFQRLATEARLTGSSNVGELYATHQLAGVQLAGSDADAAYQSVRARLSFVPRAPAADAGAGRTQEFRLLRRMGSKTPAVGLLEGKCPHCGAPLKVAATGRCAYCEAVINSGEHDWVLIDIADGTANMHRKAEVHDLGALRAVDPALSADELEDRAALAWWRWHEARVSRDVSRLSTSATESFCEQQTREERAGPAPRLAGSAAFELRALARGDAQEQQAHVEARWVERDGQGADTHRRAVVRLRRQPDALTSRPQGLATARCTRCLGPLPESAAGCCSFCQTTFDTVWRLDAIMEWDAWFAWFTTERAKSDAAPAATWLSQLPAAEKELVVETLAAIARADAVVTDSERALLHRAAAALNVDPSVVERALAANGPAPTLSRQRLRRDKAKLVLEWLVDLTVADGHADARERKLLELIGRDLEETETLQRLLGARLRRQTRTSSSRGHPES